MKLIIVLLLTGAAFCPLWAADVAMPSDPAEPVVNDTVLPDVTPPDYAAPADSSRLYMLKGWLTYSGGQFSEGVLSLSNSIQLAFTNFQNGVLSVTSLPLYEVESILITGWKGVKTNDDYYCFMPSEYRFFTNTGTTNYLIYHGNIPALNVLSWSTDQGRETRYSVFFDRWIPGRKGNFRWENTRALEFIYNETHPLPGTVTGVRFDRNY